MKSSTLDFLDFFNVIILKSNKIHFFKFYFISTILILNPYWKFK